MLLSRIETKSPYPLQHFIEHLPGHHHLGKLEHKPPRMTHQSPAYLDESRLNTCQGADEPRAVLEPLIEQHKVDIWIGGHQHAYERTLPVENDGVNVDTTSCGLAPFSICAAPDHTIYFTVGTGGGQLYADSSSSCGTASNCNLWSAVKINGFFGHLRFSVDARDLTAEFVDIDRNILDSVVISLDSNNPPVADGNYIPV